MWRFWASINLLYAEVYDQERDSSAVFQELPFYYIEIAHLLLRHAKDCFDDLYKVALPPYSLHSPVRHFHSKQLILSLS